MFEEFNVGQRPRFPTKSERQMGKPFSNRMRDQRGRDLCVGYRTLLTPLDVPVVQVFSYYAAWNAG